MNKDKVYPLVSIMIATYNSGEILRLVLNSIEAQSYPKNKIEVLVIDGGSSDNTREIATEYGCSIYDNTETEVLTAKYLGLKNSNGEYLITLDHDEVLESCNSIENKVIALQMNKDCHVASISGYKRPKDYPLLNEYLSDFGDPFSLFIYNFSALYPFVEKSFKKYFSVQKETDDYFIVECDLSKKNIIMELCAGGVMIDCIYFRKYFPELFTYEGKSAQVHMFYYMHDHGEKNIICMKNDSILHYSVDSLRAYLPKLSWRIKNNIHYKDVGAAGFSGRVQFQAKNKLKKFLFIPYSFSVILPFFHSIFLFISRKNPVYLLHTFFAIYVSVEICFQYLLKITGGKIKRKTYDGKKVVEDK